jgi:hypothetical protein
LLPDTCAHHPSLPRPVHLGLTPLWESRVGEGHWGPAWAHCLCKPHVHQIFIEHLLYAELCVMLQACRSLQSGQGPTLSENMVF